MLCYNNAHEIWHDLEKRFGKSSFAQLYSLQQELTDLIQSSSMTIVDYFSRVKSLWDKIDHLDLIPACSFNSYWEILDESTKPETQFLMRLDDQFHQARTNILMMSEFLTIQATYRILVQEERYKDICKVAITNNENMTFLADNTRGYPDSKGKKFAAIVHG